MLVGVISANSELHPAGPFRPSNLNRMTIHFYIGNYAVSFMCDRRFAYRMFCAPSLDSLGLSPRGQVKILDGSTQNFETVRHPLFGLAPFTIRDWR